MDIKPEFKYTPSPDFTPIKDEIKKETQTKVAVPNVSESSLGNDEIPITKGRGQLLNILV